MRELTQSLKQSKKSNFMMYALIAALLVFVPMINWFGVGWGIFIGILFFGCVVMGYYYYYLPRKKKMEIIKISPPPKDAFVQGAMTLDVSLSEIDPTEDSIEREIKPLVEGQMPNTLKHLSSGNVATVSTITVGKDGVPSMKRVVVSKFRNATEPEVPFNDLIDGIFNVASEDGNVELEVDISSLDIIGDTTIEIPVFGKNPYLAIHVGEIYSLQPNIVEKTLLGIFKITGKMVACISVARPMVSHEVNEISGGLITAGEMLIEKDVISRMSILCEMPKGETNIRDLAIEIKALLDKVMTYKMTYGAIDKNPFGDIEKFNLQPPEGTFAMTLEEYNMFMVKEGMPKAFRGGNVHIGLCPFTLDPVTINTRLTVNPIIAISGESGAGKSELAKWIAHRLNGFTWVTDFGGASKSGAGWALDRSLREIELTGNMIIDPFTLPYVGQEGFMKVIESFMSLLGIKTDNELKSTLSELYLEDNPSFEKFNSIVSDEKLSYLAANFEFIPYGGDMTDIYWNLSSSECRSVNFALITAFITQNMMAEKGHSISVIMDEVARLVTKMDDSYYPFDQSDVMSLIETRLTDILRDTRRREQPVVLLFHRIKETLNLPPWLYEFYDHAGLRLDFDPDGAKTQAIRSILLQTTKNEHFVAVTLGEDQKTAKVVYPKGFLRGKTPVKEAIK